MNTLLKLTDGCVLHKGIPLVTPEETEFIGFKPKGVLRLNAIESSLREEAECHDVEWPPLKRRKVSELDAAVLTLRGSDSTGKCFQRPLGSQRRIWPNLRRRTPLNRPRLHTWRTPAARRSLLPASKL